jgi:hypothetical protein
LYWTSVALLQLSPFIFSHIFHDALLLLRGLLHSSVFLQKVAISHDDRQQQQHNKTGSSSSLYSQLLTLARSSWGYNSLAYLVSKVHLRFVIALSVSFAATLRILLLLLLLLLMLPLVM